MFSSGAELNGYPEIETKSSGLAKVFEFVSKVNALEQEKSTNTGRYTMPEAPPPSTRVEAHPSQPQPSQQQQTALAGQTARTVQRTQSPADMRRLENAGISLEQFRGMEAQQQQTLLQQLAQAEYQAMIEGFNVAKAGGQNA